jgi:hypothetical protein
MPAWPVETEHQSAAFFGQFFGPSIVALKAEFSAILMR